MAPMTTFAFDTDFAEIVNNPTPYVDNVFSSLESAFLLMPRGEGFINYPVFESAYEALKMATGGFSMLNAEVVAPVVMQHPIALIVLRAMLGFTPSEWAYVTSREEEVIVTQGQARSLDRAIRLKPEKILSHSGAARERFLALVRTACRLLSEGAPISDPAFLHRLDKADTLQGMSGIRNLADLGVPYAMLLYERFLGRPFAGHRDSVSGHIGDGLENAIEEQLTHWGISFRKTRRAERIIGFDQAPDFIIPSEFNPQIVIEAKITEDDGTARDKATRIQHLAEISQGRFELIACIGGRGFKERRKDMEKMLIATRGKIFTPATLAHLVPSSRLREFASRPDAGAKA